MITWCYWINNIRGEIFTCTTFTTLPELVGQGTSETFQDCMVKQCISVEEKKTVSYVDQDYIKLTALISSLWRNFSKFGCWFVWLSSCVVSSSIPQIKQARLSIPIVQASNRSQVVGLDCWLFFCLLQMVPPVTDPAVFHECLFQSQLYTDGHTLS